MVVSPCANETDVVGVDARHTSDHQLMSSGGSNHPNPMCIDLDSDGERPTIVQKEDVLLGRGKSNKYQPGNVRYSALIDKNRDRYFGLIHSGDKTLVTKEILDSVLAEGRFLKKEGGQWVVVEKETARQKIAHAFQYRRRRSLQHGDSVPTRPQMSGGDPLRQRISHSEPLIKSSQNKVRFPSFAKSMPPVLPQKAKPAPGDPPDYHASHRDLSTANPWYAFPPTPWQASCALCQPMGFCSQASTFLELASKFSLVYSHHGHGHGLISNTTDPPILPADLLRCCNAQDLQQAAPMVAVEEAAFSVLEDDDDDNIVQLASHHQSHNNTEQLDPPLFQATTSLGSFATIASQQSDGSSSSKVADTFMDG